MEEFRLDDQPAGIGLAQEKPLFIRLVLQTGMVSTDRQAEYVLLGIAGLCVVLAFLIPVFMTGSSDGTPVPPEEIQRIMNVSGEAAL